MKQQLCSLVTFALFSLFACPLFPADPIRLFDGETLDGWVRSDGKPITQGWEVVDGMLHLSQSGERGGNLLTDQEYVDFDLEFEWKIAKGGNNGVKYRVRKYGNRDLGCEYQMLDDGEKGSIVPWKGSTGSLYNVYEPSSLEMLKPVGEFNHSRIVVWGNHIEHWLNGERILSVWVGSSEWYRRIAESKFAKVEGFGQNRSGKIMLTDHNSEVWFRNIVLTPLPAPEIAYASKQKVCQRPWFTRAKSLAQRLAPSRKQCAPTRQRVKRFRRR